MEFLKSLLATSNLIFSILLGYIVNFFAPIFPFLVIVLVLVASDLYTGIKAAKIEGTYEPLKASTGFRKTVDKIIQYFIAILLSEGMVLAFEIPVTYLPLTYIVALYIASVELKSNFENIARTTGTDVWEVIKERIDSFLNSPNRSKKGKGETENKES